jgi:hypothetical protein
VVGGCWGPQHPPMALFLKNPIGYRVNAEASLSQVRMFEAMNFLDLNFLSVVWDELGIYRKRIFLLLFHLNIFTSYSQ